MTAPDPRLSDGLLKAVVGIHAVLGTVFLAVGAAVATGAAWVIYLLLEEPARIPLVSLITGGGKDLRGVRGTLGSESFEIELGEPLFWLLALLVGVLMLAVVVSIAKGLLTVGLDLLKPVLNELRRN